MSIWYFGELTKVCAYWFKFELFQVVPIIRGNGECHNLIASYPWIYIFGDSTLLNFDSIIFWYFDLVMGCQIKTNGYFLIFENENEMITFI